jgi:hypothetical protein
MRNSAYISIILILIACAGCGRKLPPLPPAMPDPVEVLSIKFEGNEVVAKARCNVAGATVILLGKPKGLCPACMDDLAAIQKITLTTPGEVVLKDPVPEADYMVYRITAEHDSSRWTTPAQIVVRKQ